VPARRRDGDAPAHRRPVTPATSSPATPNAPTPARRRAGVVAAPGYPQWVSYAFKVPVGSQLRLSEHDPGRQRGLTKKQAEKELAELTEELADLQEELFGARQHAVLVVLQGSDTSGKDGTIKHVFRALTPVALRVVSFQPPTEEELAHHFLWRIDRALPPKGFVGVFNRSQYEDVIVPRVKAPGPPEEWRGRYDEINEFERMLVRNGTIVVKFFLHISREEQLERLLAREREVTKAWKLSPGDWRERARWDQYVEAYEEAISRCNTADSPWYVVPSDHKWYRNLAVAEAIVETLRAHRDGWRSVLRRLATERLAELAALRADGAIEAPEGER
jgi:PPK2 family polyphosphate:nucleotide phosphotransferase